MNEPLSGWVKKLAEKSVVVLGDLVADEYVYGMTSRISREAPVLVVRYSDNEYRLGGSANAAHNVADLGARAIPVGVVGDDEAGVRVADLCKRYGMVTSGILKNGRPTTRKTRILAGAIHTTKQQVLRLDREDTTPYHKDIDDRVILALTKALKKADALLVSDYGLGVLSKRVIQAVRAYAKDGGIVCVDSRYNLRAYKGVTAVTPNEPEAEAAAAMPIESDAHVKKAGAFLLKELQSRAVVITRGQKGMAIFEPDEKPVYVPVVGADEVADVTGAGDTVIATFTLALAAGADVVTAARLANCAASVTVMKQGAATVSPQELVRAAQSA
ncbi:MAG: bifunctional hydroxymethylpyrimidine kinase/phosphomethylpyrimidine kinase [Deltaproteobacteria bacterium]|nr:bifunctional hydroxymethylpyrimidine kinase/phosphomethylpyrimidine kinase [Deltaproteobacteria bacterium]